MNCLDEFKGIGSLLFIIVDNECLIIYFLFCKRLKETAQILQICWVVKNQKKTFLEFPIIIWNNLWKNFNNKIVINFFLQFHKHTGNIYELFKIQRGAVINLYSNLDLYSCFVMVIKLQLFTTIYYRNLV